ncbi:hypothetical protein SAMN04488021_14915 [Paracoccus aminovorans]|uniref:Uncharacterized protein n=2 Tax=Paracoccus aminovorans TaxID=34004 RepID=A0A1I3EIH1_9RHOB|nr:ankyrin repeat domain-containing protein [Paracoccus aminovorans]CQR84358.1 ankyrin [Paracoccus aminovorans]SFH98769.1 hypothetical protein SAMN04488021_14915 [Paracoccus aminovorans]
MRKRGTSLLALALTTGLATMADPVASRAEPVPALVATAESGDAAAVKRAIGAGAPLEARDGRGRTALLAATHANRVETARLLIEAGADVNARDHIQDSPYLYAGARGHLQILRMTLAHGADLASTNRFGGTALIPAAERGHVETVRTLIEAGVDVDHVNDLGWTALLEAIILGDGGARHVAIVDLLVKAGADAGLADRDGVTPLQHARQRGYARIAAILEQAGAR